MNDIATNSSNGAKYDNSNSNKFEVEAIPIAIQENNGIVTLLCLTDLMESVWRYR